MNEFYTFPNQRIIAITGKEPCDRTNIYAKININAMKEAINNLHSTTAYSLWTYLSSMQNDYKFAFSSYAVSKELGIKKSTIQNAIRELINKNYLVQRDFNSNIYDFYELPREKEENIKIKIHNSNNKVYDF